MDTSSKHKVNKEMIAFSNTLDKANLIDIYWIFYPQTAEYTFFSSAHRPFSKIDCMLGHKISLKKFKKTEIVSSIFF